MSKKYVPNLGPETILWRDPVTDPPSPGANVFCEYAEWCEQCKEFEFDYGLGYMAPSGVWYSENSSTIVPSRYFYLRFK
jgi:hypothetical protein